MMHRAYDTPSFQNVKQIYPMTVTKIQKPGQQSLPSWQELAYGIAIMVLLCLPFLL